MRNLYVEYKDNEILPPLVAEFSWSKNVAIMEKCKDQLEREFYIKMTKKYGWTKDVLINHIENKSYEKLKHDDLEIVKKLKENPKRYEMIMNQNFDINICAFLCANMNLDYDNKFKGFPEILNPSAFYYNMEEYQKYMITFKVKYINIEKSGNLHKLIIVSEFIHV